MIVNLKPLARIHFEASGATQTRRSVRPVEPFLRDPDEIRSSCPQHLRELLARILAIRALKTACMLGYWGRWREAREIVKRFRAPGHFGCLFAPSLVSHAFGSALASEEWSVGGMNSN